MKKKILFVGEYMLCGGVEKSLLSILSSLDKDEYDVTLLLLQKKGEFLQFVPSWVKIIEPVIPEDEFVDIVIGRRYAISKCLKKGEYVNFLKKLVRGLIISLKEDTDWGRRKAFFDKISYNIPSLEEYFDVAIDFMGYGLFNTFYVAEKVNAKVKATWIHFEIKKSNTDPRAYKKYFDKYNWVFGVSKKSVDEFIEFFPEFRKKTKIFKNIVSEDVIKRMSIESNGFDEDYDGIRILSVGRLTKEKGYDIVIPVLARLKKDGYSIRWYVIGEGSERKNLEDLIKQYKLEDCFILLGLKVNPYPFVSQCSIYVQPSRNEGYCIALAEARVFNKPIVSTNFAGAGEQIVNGETGLITEFDIEKIYSTIKSLLDDRALQKKLSLNLSKEVIDSTKEINKLYELFI